MTTKLTELDIEDLRTQAQQQGERIHQTIEFGDRYSLPKQYGEGFSRFIDLRGGLTIEIFSGQFWQPLTIQRHHNSAFPVTAKFFLSGDCGVKTNNTPEIEANYEEVTGYNYLYHLPDLTESEEYPADTPLQMVMIYANANYFQGLNPTDNGLPHPLQRLMQGSRRFHQPLGKMTLAMSRVLQQILHCPYHGSGQQLYLESKALELLALQFAYLEADSPPPRQSTLKADDLERVQYARDILVQHLCTPPSLMALARRVGLNDCTLKQGFRHLFGTTVFGYLRDCRMAQAQHLLQQSELTVAQVAAQVGYRNPEAFSTAFRRKFAVSPKAYQLGRCR
ncbi:MAG: AraC family transcriptional regulator [Cyanobacteria bacterium P01_A01_bin.123]